MMLGEECESASYWKKCGDEALEKGIKGVVIMVCYAVAISLSTGLTAIGSALGRFE